MKQNEFEKKVKIQLDELDLHPSDQVWVEVERRIRKEKRRRFIFWWPLFALLVAGGAGLYFLTSNKNNSNKKNTTKTAVNTQSEFEQMRKEEHVIMPDTTAGKSNTTMAKPAQLVNEGGSNNPVPYDKHFTTTTKADKLTISIAEGKISRKKLRLFEKQIITDQPIQKENDNESIERKEAVSTNADKVSSITNPAQVNVDSKSVIAVKQAGKIQDKTTKKEFDTASIKKEVITTATTPKQDSTATATASIKLKKKKTWHWGGSFSMGSSALADGLGILEKSTRFDAATINNIPGASLGSVTSSSTKKGPAVLVAVFAQKQVSPKLVLRLAASYNYLSWSFKVGARVDSVFAPGSASVGSGTYTNGFYRPTNSSNGERYINKYHLLGTSAELSLQIIKGKKINLYWDNALSYTRLLSSNMLHYSSTLPGYYKDNSLLQKNQLFFSTAFLLHADARFSIGPYLQYGITPVITNKQSPQRHLSSFGLRTNFLFGK